MTVDEILKLVDTHGGAIDCHPFVELGQFPIVNQLAEDGLIEKRETQESVTFALTDKGREQIADYLANKMNRRDILEYVDSHGGSVDWFPLAERGAMQLVNELVAEGCVEKRETEESISILLTPAGKEQFARSVATETNV